MRDARSRAWAAAALVVFGLAAALGALGTACRTTQAWERGVHARPEMNLDEGAEEEGTRHHIEAQRESGTAPGGGAGGGCGCNSGAVAETRTRGALRVGVVVAAPAI